MIEVKKYHLPPTALIPNSPRPLLHYPNLLHQLNIAPSPAAATTTTVPEQAAVQFHALFTGNNWQPRWIFRYGATQPSHYHSHVHEAMAVLAGTATIRFGRADAEAGGGAGGVEVSAKAGDVFVLPAGTAHKTFDAVPAAEFKLLTPGDGQGAVAVAGVREAVAGEGEEGLGFLMMGAYPVEGERWDFAVGGERTSEEFEEVWRVPVPERDPVLGMAEEGLCGLWK